MVSLSFLGHLDWIKVSAQCKMCEAKIYFPTITVEGVPLIKMVVSQTAPLINLSGHVHQSCPYLDSVSLVFLKPQLQW